jgi:penicillin-binding protein 2
MRINIEEGFQPPKHGLVMLQVLVLMLFCILLLRFWYLQILQGDYYAERAYKNRWREQLVYANRGLVLDDQGVILAENRPAYTVALVREDCPDVPSTLAMISQWTGEPLSKLQRSYYTSLQEQVPSFSPIPLAHNVSFGQVARIESQLVNWPGVTVLSQQRRFYTHGEMFAHVLGYVALANKKELDTHKELSRGDSVGKQGLELVLENRLRGLKGRTSLEVDALGRPMTHVIESTSKGGEDIRLSLDVDLQEAATAALGKHSGCIVVMEPDTGKLRALVTRPSYDNNLFTGRLSSEDWASLRDDERHPLQNRVIQSVYPPGSVWKLIMAAMLLKEGVDPHETVTCTGSFQLGNRTFRCWLHLGHGKVDMMQSLVQSCDVYYYTMADRLGIDKISEFAFASGFGQKTGIDLPSEKTGLVPSREWKQMMRGEPWQRGETINTSIGQGYTLVTPVQMAVYVSSLLNGGKLMKPLLLDADEPQVMGSTPSGAAERDFVRYAMQMAVEDRRGTARRILRKDAVMGGKTGTAQVVALGDTRLKAEEMLYEHRDHAWIATYGVKEGQKYVVVVMVEHGGGGSSAAGPVAREVYSYLFDGKKDNISAAQRNRAASGYVVQTDPEEAADMEEIIKASRQWEKFIRPSEQPARDRAEAGI